MIKNVVLVVLAFFFLVSCKNEKTKNDEKEVEKQENNWTICKQCQGSGKINKGLSKKSKEEYLKALNQFENANKKGLAPIRPTGHLYSCLKCNGSGLIHSKKSTQVDLKNMPHVAIIGAGIQARMQLKALTLVRDIKNVNVWSRELNKTNDNIQNNYSDFKVLNKDYTGNKKKVQQAMEASAKKTSDT